MLATDLTVSAIVEEQGRFLLVEERSSGRLVINQPGGHIEPGESPEQATEREALEESGCIIRVTGLLGLYLWIHPNTGRKYLRIAYAADLVSTENTSELDAGIVAVHWFSIADIRRRQEVLRTPVVLRSVEDYLAGKRQSEALLAEILPLQKNVDRALASAALV